MHFHFVFYYIIFLFYELTLKASKHEITVLCSRTVANILAIFSIQWIRTSNETSRTAISRTAFWEKPLPITCLIYLKLIIRLPCILPFKHFMIIIRIKKYVSVDNIPIQLPKAESHMYPSQQPWGFCSVLYIESS